MLPEPSFDATSCRLCNGDDELSAAVLVGLAFDVHLHFNFCLHFSR